MTLPPNHHSDAEGLRRQRRLLVGVSIALTLFLIAGVTFDEVVILGNTLKVARAELIPIAIWILWGYALIRYWQYFNDMPPLGFKESHERRMRTILSDFAKAIVRRDVQGPALAEGTWRPPLGFDFEGAALEPLGPDDWRVLLRYALTYRTEVGIGREMRREHAIDIVGWPAKRAYARAWWQVATRTRLATEYLLPFAVAIAPPIVGVVVLLR